MEVLPKLPPQFLRKSRISVTILEKLSPSRYVIKEVPSLHTSKEMEAFQALESMIQQLYHDEKQRFHKTPEEKTMVIVKRLDDDKFYRAVIKEVQRGRSKTMFKVYLVDYGIECVAMKDRLFVPKKVLAAFPFQAVQFVLMGLRPLSLHIDAADVKLNLSPAKHWDQSAEDYIDDLLERIYSATVEVSGYDVIGKVYGTMYISAVDKSGIQQEPFCLSTYFVGHKYACIDAAVLKNVINLSDDEAAHTSDDLMAMISSFQMYFTDSEKKDASFLNSNHEKLRRELESSHQNSAYATSIENTSSLPLQMKIPNIFKNCSFSSSPEKQSSTGSSAKKPLPSVGRGLIVIKESNGVSSTENSSSSSPLHVENPITFKSSSSSPGKQNIAGGSANKPSLSFGRGLNLMRVSNSVTSAENSPSLTLQMQSPMISTYSSPNLLSSSRKQRIDCGSVNKSLPVGRGLNEMKETNNVTSAENSPSLSLQMQSLMISTDSSPNLVSSFRKRHVGCGSVNKSLPVGRGLNEMKKINSVTSVKNSPSHSLQVQNPMISTDSSQNLFTTSKKQSIGCGSCVSSAENSPSLSLQTQSPMISDGSSPTVLSSSSSRKRSIGCGSVNQSLSGVGRGLNVVKESNFVSSAERSSPPHSQKGSPILFSGSSPCLSSEKQDVIGSPTSKPSPNFGRGCKGMQMPNSISLSVTKASPSSSLQTSVVAVDNSSSFGQLESKKNTNSALSEKTIPSIERRKAYLNPALSVKKSSFPEIENLSSHDGVFPLPVKSEKLSLSNDALKKQVPRQLGRGLKYLNEIIVNSKSSLDRCTKIPQSVKKFPLLSDTSLISSKKIVDNSIAASSRSIGSSNGNSNEKASLLGTINSPEDTFSDASSGQFSDYDSDNDDLDDKQISQATKSCSQSSGGVTQISSTNLKALSSQEDIHQPGMTTHKSTNLQCSPLTNHEVAECKQCPSHMQLSVEATKTTNEQVSAEKSQLTNLTNEQLFVEQPNHLIAESTNKQLQVGQENATDDGVVLEDNFLSPSKQVLVKTEDILNKQALIEHVRTPPIKPIDEQTMTETAVNKQESLLSTNLTTKQPNTSTLESANKQLLVGQGNSTDSQVSIENDFLPPCKQILVETEDIPNEQVSFEDEKTSPVKPTNEQTMTETAAIEQESPLSEERTRSSSCGSLFAHSNIQENLYMSPISLQPTAIPLSLGRRLSFLHSQTATLNQCKAMMISKRRKSASLTENRKIEDNCRKVKSLPPSVCSSSSGTEQYSSSVETSPEKKVSVNLQLSDDVLTKAQYSECYDSTKDSEMISRDYENQESGPDSNGVLAESLMQNIVTVSSEMASSEEAETCIDEACEPDVVFEHFSKVTISSPCQLTIGYSQSAQETDLDFTDRSLYNERESLIIKMGCVTNLIWFDYKEANFDPHIQQRMKDVDFCGPSSIQSVFWPLMMRCMTQSIIAIGPQHSGKTIGYLIPILSNLLRGCEYANLPKDHGPIAIILCSSWKKVLDVDRQVELFLGQGSKISVLTLYADGVEEQTKVISLINGCHILIATPLCLMDYCEKDYCGKKVVSFVRCCHIIFDDGNDIVNHYANVLPSVMKAFTTTLESRRKMLSCIQLILCAENWTRRLAVFQKKFMFYNTGLLFSSSLEAAIYCKVPMYVHMCEESTKVAKLLAILDDMKGRKTVICSDNSKNADAVYSALSNTNHATLYARENMPSYHLKSLKMQWNVPHSKEETVVMVLPDLILLQLDLNDADCIIHFDLPGLSRLQFSNRFSCIRKHMHPEVKNGLECHVLFTEECRTQATSLYTILCRIGLNAPTELKHQSILQKQAFSNMEMPLCPYMKSLGSCSVKSCSFRHNIDEELDCPLVEPSEGDIHASVCHVFSPTHFYIKIHSYIHPKTKKVVSKTGVHASLAIEIQDYFRMHEASLRLCSRKIVVNELYAVQDCMEYYRCKVLEVLDHLCQAKVLYIDEGFIKIVKFEQFLLLPEELLQAKPLAVEAYICKVKPVDPYHEWNPGATKYMFDLISNQKINAKIVLCLGETLFLHPAVIRTELLSFIHSRLNLINLGDTLKSKGLGVANRKHLDLLYEACHGKISRPDILNTSAVETSQVKCSWAFLDADAVDLIYVSHVESPNQFFVQKSKSADSLDRLVKDIAAKVKNKSLEPCQNLEIGMFCLAPYMDGDEIIYNRCEILSHTEVSGEIVACALYVDYGDRCSKVKKSELFLLSPDLVLLPFQGIECDLASVGPCHGEWSNTAIDTFLNLTRDEADQQIQLKVKVLEKTERPGGGNVYKVDLQTIAGTYVSDFLIENGFAEEKEIPWTLDYVSNLNVEHYQGDESDVDESDCDELPEEKDCAAMFAGVCAGIINRENVQFICDRFNEVRNQRKLNGHEKSSHQTNQNASSLEIINHQETMQNIKVAPLNNEDSISSRIPHITWWNTSEEVTVTIHVADVQTYEMNPFSDGFRFETTVMRKRYIVEEVFYDEILVDEFTPKCFGRYVEFQFKKQNKGMWPRLIKSDEKMFYIMYDPMHIDTEDEDSEENASYNPSAAPFPDGSESHQRDDGFQHGELETEEESEGSDDSSDEECDYLGFKQLLDPRAGSGL